MTALGGKPDSKWRYRLISRFILLIGCPWKLFCLAATFQMFFEVIAVPGKRAYEGKNCGFGVLLP
jgi:hypothetical protein